MKYCEDIRIVSENGYVVLNNPHNGCWIKLTEECFNYVNNYINTESEHEDFINQFDLDSRIYIEDILNKLKKLELIDYNNKNELVSVDIAITALCNLKCLHCANSVMEVAGEPSTEELKSVFQILSKIGVKTICITGGEPLVRKDFFELTEFARERFDKLCLMSNATLINEDNAIFLADNYDDISISIDGYDKKTCEAIRGVNVFDKIDKAIRLLKNAGMNKISVSSVITSINRNGESAFYELNEKWGTVPILRRFAPVGRGRDNDEKLFKEMFIEDLNGRSINYKKTEVNWGFLPQYRTTICDAFISNIYIGSDLCIYPCGALNLQEFKGDNILKIDNFYNYMRNKGYRETSGYNNYKSIMPDRAPYCSGCKVYMFCNTCPAYMYLYNKYGYLEAYCKSRKTILEKKIYG